MNERIKELRKALGLTLEKFGERLGVKKAAVSKWEHGDNVTDQIIKSICREFHVDYIWLTTGEGEMFRNSDDDFYEKLDRVMASETDIRKNLFKALLDAPEEDLAALEKWIDFYTDLKKES